MADIEYQKASIAGHTIAFELASSGGDKVYPNARGAVLVSNGDATPVTVTIAVPGNTRFGQPQPDVAVVVPSGETRMIGPLPTDLGDRATDGKIAITYSSIDAVGIAAIEI